MSLKYLWVYYLYFILDLGNIIYPAVNLTVFLNQKSLWEIKLLTDGYTGWFKNYPIYEISYLWIALSIKFAMHMMRLRDNQKTVEYEGDDTHKQ